MSVANSSRPTPVRTTSCSVKLAPYLIEMICELTRVMRDKGQVQTETSGLLFGMTEPGTTLVDALKMFKDSGPRSDLARRERLDKAFDTAVAEAKIDPELSSRNLVGWFSLRGSSGLLTSDIDFHNRHFKEAQDLAVVIWREAETQAIAEIYSKIEGGRLSNDEYRWSSVRLSTEMRRVSEPIDLVMRAKVSEEHYLRAYQAEAGEAGEEWKKFIHSLKRTLLAWRPSKKTAEAGNTSLWQSDAKSDALGRPGIGAQNWNPDTLFRKSTGAAEPHARIDPGPESGKIQQTRAETSRAEPTRIVEPENGFVTARSARPERPEEISGLPMVIGNRAQPRRGTPWAATSLVFLLFCGITFAILAGWGVGPSSGKFSQVMRVLFPGTDLGIHVESQGDKLLLSWNRRNPTVASASEAILQIFDGSGRREIRLDPGQVADGSVLYKPVSSDVTFRLEVHGTDQSTVSGSQRVLDATNSAAVRAATPLDLSKEAPQLAAMSNSPARGGSENAARITASVRQPGIKVNRSVQNDPVSVPIPLPSGPALAAATPPATSPALADAPGSAVNRPENTGGILNSAASNDTAANTGKPQQTAAATPLEQIPSPATGAGSTINGWDSNVPENRPPAPPERKEPVATSETSSFVSPKPLLQVMPNTKQFPPNSVTQVTRVEVQVNVDVYGRVADAHVTSGSTRSVLSIAALSAARQWTFQPATLRGAKVASQHTIVFEFRPDFKK